MTTDARLECYAEITKCVKTLIVAYYQEHPELIGDKRSQAAIEQSMGGLDCIFGVLDKYTITKPEE